ncbi:MAG: 50S ribosomal protein L5 [Promethearchaeota archaeon]
MSEKEILEDWKSNQMRRPRIHSVTVNIGVGGGGERLEKAIKVLETVTNQRPTPVKAKKSLRDFNLRKGERIACKVTLRGSKASEFLKAALSASESTLKRQSFDLNGNFSFGIKEHIELPNTAYDPDIGIFGMDVCVSLERPGYRVKRRKISRKKIPKSHRITREEAILFIEREFNAKLT